MFQAQNKIIIVDNDAGHLTTLSSRFHTNGIGCKEFEYDVMYDAPLKGVRAAFFDINLLDSAGGDGRIFNTLVNAIKQYIHVDNGPFALIFWTSNSSMIDRFKTYVESRHSDCPRPFVVQHIDKDEFLGASPDELESEIERILDDDIMKLMFDFEKRSEKGAYDVIKNIYDIIPSNDTWGLSTNFSANFEKVFSKISTSTLGFKAAKVNPDKAVYEALIPMLNYKISNGVDSNDWGNFLESLGNATKISDIRQPPRFKESTINSIFHIDTTSEKSDSRGAVLKMSKNHFKVKKAFGKSYRDWIMGFMNFNQNTDAQRADFEKIVLKSELILIEVSAACDFQQNKPRLNKYIYGVKFPVFSSRFKPKDSALSVGKFIIDNDEFEIWLNLNFVLGVNPSSKIIIDDSSYLFTFKKEIMDMIGNRYANHVSRIGITSF